MLSDEGAFENGDIWDGILHTDISGKNDQQNVAAGSVKIYAGNKYLNKDYPA